MFERVRVYVNKERVNFAGMDTGKLTIVAQNEKCMVIKEKGHKYFAGRGERAYAPAETHVLKIDCVVPKEEASGSAYRGTCYECTPMISYETKKK